jgi:hypothetical protein
MRKWTSSPKGSSTLRTLSSTLPLLRNTQEWFSGEINRSHRLRRNSSFRGEPKMLRLAMPTSSRSMLQEWKKAPIVHATEQTNRMPCGNVKRLGGGYYDGGTGKMREEDDDNGRRGWAEVTRRRRRWGQPSRPWACWPESWGGNQYKGGTMMQQSTDRTRI